MLIGLSIRNIKEQLVFRTFLSKLSGKDEIDEIMMQILANGNMVSGNFQQAIEFYEKSRNQENNELIELFILN